ncbi:isopeptide-forming domain-containing fimbrial protein [Vibrio alginolyticus]
MTKSADPVSGTAVRAGDTITYTISGVNTGNTTLDPASIVDDLSAVLAHAQYGGDASASTGAVELDGTTLTWTGALAPGARVDITYTVTVDADATGVLLRNTVTGEGTPSSRPTRPTRDSPTTPRYPGHHAAVDDGAPGRHPRLHCREVRRPRIGDACRSRQRDHLHRHGHEHGCTVLTLPRSPMTCAARWPMPRTTTT